MAIKIRAVRARIVSSHREQQNNDRWDENVDVYLHQYYYIACVTQDRRHDEESS